MLKFLMFIQKWLPESLRNKILGYVLKKKLGSVFTQLSESQVREPILNDKGEPVKLDFSKMFEKF